MSMIEVTIYNADGGEVGRLSVDEAWFGGEVHADILRLAVRRHEANQRVGTAASKGRGQVAGSTKKIYAQKHTGRARAGTRRTGKRRGGGATFGKVARDFSLEMPRQMRRRALDSALLARMKDAELVVLDGLTLDQPKTRLVAKALKALGADRTCLLAIPAKDAVLYKSARNIDRVRVRPVMDLTAYDVLWPKRVVFTRPAFEALVEARKN